MTVEKSILTRFASPVAAAAAEPPQRKFPPRYCVSSSSSSNYTYITLESLLLLVPSSCHFIHSIRRSVCVHIHTHIGTVLCAADYYATAKFFFLLCCRSEFFRSLARFVLFFFSLSTLQFPFRDDVLYFLCVSCRLLLLLLLLLRCWAFYAGAEA
jgi:hypothetical protein